MTREELLGIEGATLAQNDSVRIRFNRVLGLGATLSISPKNGSVLVDEDGDGPDCVFLGRAATVADVERLVVALRGLGR